MFVPATHDILQSNHKIKIPMIKVWVRVPGEGASFEQFADFREAFRFIEKNPYAEKHPLICYDGYEINIFDYKTSEDYDFLLKNALRIYIEQVFYSGMDKADREEIDRLFAGILAFIHVNMWEQPYLPVQTVTDEPTKWWEFWKWGKRS